MDDGYGLGCLGSLGSCEHDGARGIGATGTHRGRQDPTCLSFRDGRIGEVLVKHRGTVVEDRATVEQVNECLGTGDRLPLPNEIVEVLPQPVDVAGGHDDVQSSVPGPYLGQSFVYLANGAVCCGSHDDAAVIEDTGDGYGVPQPVE
jgi:hypothetical protein